MSIKESNISAKLEELRELLTKIESASNEQFTSIDIDLLLSKTQDLYENILSLKSSSEIQTTTESNIDTEAVSEESASETINEEPIFDNDNTNAPKEPEIDVEVPMEAVTETHEETVSTPDEVDTDSIIDDEKDEMEQPETTSKQSTPTDLFGNPVSNDEIAHSDETESINEKISKENHEPSIVEQHKSTPITDLGSAININKKFSYLNELFQGDIQLYNSAIEHLNGCTNFQEAEDYIQTSLQEKYNWKEKEKIANDFITLVSRRFIPAA